MAIASKLQAGFNFAEPDFSIKPSFRVYTMIGDGECQSGELWEAAMSAGHFKLDNLTAFLDYNGLQIDGKVEKVMGISPIADKFKAFRWNVLEIDGHNPNQIIAALEDACSCKEKPTMIIARTVKGKGVSFMENKVEWHGKPIGKEELERALEELA
jgi:transketolase